MSVHEFQTSIEWKRAKEGVLSAPDLPAMDVASPPAFGGPAATWTPEHFFVAAANVCLMTTFLAIAEYSKFPVRGYRSDGSGTLEKVPGEGFRFTSIVLRPRIRLEQASDEARAARLLEKAEAACLIARSMKTPVTVSPVFEC